MSSLQAYQLLVNAAKLYRAERETFSREEIVRKINQIKYLSEQKNIPVMDIKKEILHLQNKFGYLGELEKRFNQQKKSESVKVNSLKKEIVELKKKLALTKEKDLHKKVEKLSFMLGEILAKQGSKIDVDLSNKVIQEIKKDKNLKIMPYVRVEKESLKIRREKVKSTFPEGELTREEELIKVKMLQEKLGELKKQVLFVSLDKSSGLQNMISMIESRLEPYYQKYPELKKTESEEFPEINIETSAFKEVPILKDGETVRHDLRFEKPGDQMQFGKKTLIPPLPPPPQPKRKKD